ncbi:hypothetical protein THAOC_21127 [Thalassiosira oceanica]|uniref:Uncharacterized protein n=1 Tax=Thalassiosira oceanica TaxID=159749 RepID=K0SCS7_THAOC|nr:hypothetical protein THAOC_21127 [Thalassiosira oceanica]|eukprot:EJK58721.1 hypothetical protein THAOC_21127 [Thalassiosira oceanica]
MACADLAHFHLFAFARDFSRLARDPFDESCLLPYASWLHYPNGLCRSRLYPVSSQVKLLSRCPRDLYLSPEERVTKRVQCIVVDAVIEDNRATGLTSVLRVRYFYDNVVLNGPVHTDDRVHFDCYRYFFHANRCGDVSTFCFCLPDRMCGNVTASLLVIVAHRSPLFMPNAYAVYLCPIVWLIRQGRILLTSAPLQSH